MSQEKTLYALRDGIFTSRKVLNTGMPVPTTLPDHEIRILTERGLVGTKAVGNVKKKTVFIEPVYGEDEGQVKPITSPDLPPFELSKAVDEALEKVTNPETGKVKVTKQPEKPKQGKRVIQSYIVEPTKPKTPTPTKPKGKPKKKVGGPTNNKPGRTKAETQEDNRENRCECGRGFSSPQGLRMHKRHCKGKKK